MEDDIHFDYVDRWTTSLREILDSAPADWDVLQLTLNNAKVLRALEVSKLTHETGGQILVFDTVEAAVTHLIKKA